MADFNIIIKTSSGDFDEGRIGEYVDAEDSNPTGGLFVNQSLIKSLPNALTNMTQTNPAFVPTQTSITVSPFNVVNGLRFDGANDFMDFANRFTVVDTDITLLAVAIPDTTASTQYLIDTFPLNPSAELALLATDGSAEFGASFNGGFLTDPATVTAEVQTLAFTGEAASNISRIFRGGVELATSTFTNFDLSTATDRWFLGGNTGPTDTFDGDVYEAHIWTRALAPAELQVFQLGIDEKFGITPLANNFVFPKVANWEDAPTLTQPSRINPIGGAPHKYLLVTLQPGVNDIQVVVDDDTLGIAPSDAALGGDLFTYFTIEHPGALPFISTATGFSSVAKISFTDPGHYAIGVTRTGATTGTVVFHFDAE